MQGGKSIKSCISCDTNSIITSNLNLPLETQGIKKCSVYRSDVFFNRELSNVCLTNIQYYLIKVPRQVDVWDCN